MGLLNKLASEIDNFKEEMSTLAQGYSQGMQLMEEVDERQKLVTNGTSDIMNELIMSTQITQWKNWLDIYDEFKTAYSCGIALYSAIHGKERKAMYNLWRQIPESDIYEKTFEHEED